MTVATGAADVTREVLRCHLRGWVPAALQRARRGTFVHGGADRDAGRSAEVALRELAAHAAMLGGRELSMVAVAEDVTVVGPRLHAVQRELRVPPTLVAHTVAGGIDGGVGVALRAAGAARAPVLGFLDVGASPPGHATVAALGTGRPAEMLLALPTAVLDDLAVPESAGADGDRFFGDDRWRAVVDEPAPRRRAFLLATYRAALGRAGFPLMTAAEPVPDDGADGAVLVFATTSGKSLEAFKEALWVGVEHAGWRLRDAGGSAGDDGPGAPGLGPVLLDHLRTVGSATVTDLRTFALTRTVYRAADATRAVQDLLADGAAVRRPEQGRLGGDVVLSPGR